MCFLHGKGFRRCAYLRPRYYMPFKPFFHSCEKQWAYFQQDLPGKQAGTTFCAYLSCPAGCGRGAQLAQRRFLEYPVKWSVIKRKRANLVGLYVEEVNR